MRGQSGKFEQACAAAGTELGKAIKKNTPVYLVYASVESVNEENKTFDAVVDNDRLFRDMELNVIPNGGNSIYLIPAVGSVIILGFTEGFIEEPFLVKSTKIDRFIITNEQSEDSYIDIINDAVEVKRGSSVWRIEKDKISLTADFTELNGGENDGLVLINELTSSLNNFVSEVRGMVQTFNSHRHSYTWTALAGSGITAGSTSSMSAPSNFVKDDYENKIVLQ